MEPSLRTGLSGYDSPRALPPFTGSIPHTNRSDSCSLRGFPGSGDSFPAQTFRIPVQTDASDFTEPIPRTNHSNFRLRQAPPQFTEPIPRTNPSNFRLTQGFPPFTEPIPRATLPISWLSAR